MPLACLSVLVKSAAHVKARILQQIIEIVLNKTEQHLIEKHDLMEFREQEKTNRMKTAQKKYTKT